MGHKQNQHIYKQNKSFIQFSRVCLFFCKFRFDKLCSSPLLRLSLMFSISVRSEVFYDSFFMSLHNHSLLSVQKSTVDFFLSIFYFILFIYCCIDLRLYCNYGENHSNNQWRCLAIESGYNEIYRLGSNPCQHANRFA